MIRAKNYATVSKFVKVMTKILWPLFFPDTVYMQRWTVVTSYQAGDYLPGVRSTKAELA